MQSLLVLCCHICLFLTLFLLHEDVSKKKLLKTMSKNVLCFLLEILWFQVPHYFTPYWIYFYMLWESSQFDSFACNCPSFPTPFIEEGSLSPLVVLALFVRINWPYKYGFISWISVFVSLIYLSIFVQIHTVLITVDLWYI